MSDAPLPIAVGILTRGKPTLALAITALLIQEPRPARVHLVDTGTDPIIRREDVIAALKLATDRGIPMDYEVLRDRERPFSHGRLRLLEVLDLPHLCWLDDDVVLSAGALHRLFQAGEALATGGQPYGYVAPYCVNAGVRESPFAGRAHWTSGGLIFLDDTVRLMLHSYYSEQIDVLDRARGQKVWEMAFLTEVLPALGRPCSVVRDTTVYHLDYGPRQNWDLLDIQVGARTSQVAQAYATRFGRLGEPAR